MLTAPTVHCSLPSCILPCSVQFFGLAVAEHDFVLQLDYDRECAKISVYEVIEINENESETIVKYKRGIREL